MPGISKGKNIDSKENLWTSILSEVQTKGSTKLPSNKSILVLGDNESGKTTLIAKLQGVEDPKKGSGLEYAYIDVRDEYAEDQTRLGVWVLDGEKTHSQLLRFALSSESFPNTLILLVVSMTTPWGILDQLNNWVGLLQHHIDSLNLTVEQLKEYKQNIIRRWNEYVEVGDDSTDIRRTSKNYDEEGFPLGEGVLTSNLGIDIVVVLTKTDYMTVLEKDGDYRDEHFDFIQQWIRRFCLQYGAALFYTSAKEDKNCDLLYKYLVHKLYGLEFKTPALIVEKEAVMIPSGWDSLKKIAIMCENLQSIKPDDIYNSVIAPPLTRKGVNREVELVAEDEQTFLTRMLALLQQGTGDRGTAVQKTGDRRIQASPSAITSPKKIDTSKVSGVGGEGVLANFFNSLLHKKPGTSPASSPNTSLKNIGSNTNSANSSFNSSVEKNVIWNDAASELDRLTRSSTPPHNFDSSNC